MREYEGSEDYVHTTEEWQALNYCDNEELRQGGCRKESEEVDFRHCLECNMQEWKMFGYSGTIFEKCQYEQIMEEGMTTYKMKALQLFDVHDVHEMNCERTICELMNQEMTDCKMILQGEEYNFDEMNCYLLICGRKDRRMSDSAKRDFYWSCQVIQ